MMEITIEKEEPTSNDTVLSLAKITVDADYLKKWNERLTDFLVLTKNGELLRDTLYRIGGLNNPNLKKDKYFMLLKYKEAFYSKEIVGERDNKHLKGVWVIIDSKGDEKIEFEGGLDHPYLIGDSRIYSYKNHYYDVETGYDYGYTSSSFESKDFVFINTKFEKDKSKCGVIKINKNDGTYEVFPLV